MSIDLDKIKLMSEKKLKDKLMKYEMKRWQASRGKNMDFSIQTTNQYQVYYDDILKINADGQDGMGVEQLKEPFISLGLASSKDDVDLLIKSVDADGSGRIEFDEFLDIIKNQSKKKGGVNKNEKITTFFQNLSENNFAGQSNLSHFSFKTVMNIMRRENLLKFFISKDEEDKKEGGKILKAYSNMLQEQVKNKKNK
jgi:centrin-1